MICVIPLTSGTHIVWGVCTIFYETVGKCTDVYFLFHDTTEMNNDKIYDL